MHPRMTGHMIAKLVRVFLSRKKRLIISHQSLLAVNSCGFTESGVFRRHGAQPPNYDAQSLTHDHFLRKEQDDIYVVK